ncbi:hypothetical protein [Marinobacterium mangrovicola]|uniref:Uncharacterized protein n=1 Tax=Marinobacterium mangrovicola TaxID=1476959 RepID=A0A4V6ND01_9GAMM|nr:hypothetical protein [Marinobacterium mangrovicola]TCK06886.1 hypothetical protein CLV83_1736 [Marinobacterium mangrovicola]
MQQVLIINRLIPEKDASGALVRLSGVTHDGRAVSFESCAEQRINLLALEFQQTPLVMLTDRLIQPFSEIWQVPADALVAVVPIPADQVRALLERGEGDSLRDAVKDQLSAEPGSA